MIGVFWLIRHGWCAFSSGYFSKCLESGQMRFLVLDGWRGVCAMMVALFHLHVIGHIYPGSLDSVRIINNSWLFVDFFFVLSGFIITHSLGRGLDDLVSLIAFAIRRFGRLWPTHLVMIMILLAYEFAKYPPDIALVVLNFQSYSINDFLLSLSYCLTFTHSLPWVYTIGIDKFADINPPSWSISVECWIYLTLGLILLYGRRWHAAIILALIIASGLTMYMRVGAIGSSFEYGLMRCAYGFFVGHVVYLLYGKSQFDVRPWRWLMTAIEVLVVALSAAFVTLTGPVPESLLAPAVFGVTVYVFAFEAGMISKVMMAKPFQTLGTLSFTIYMGHAFVVLAYADCIRMVQDWYGVTYSLERDSYWGAVTLVSFPSATVANLSVLLYAVLVVGFAAVLSRWVEVPWRDRVNRFAKAYAVNAANRSAVAGRAVV